MAINFRPLKRTDENYSNVIELYRDAFPGAEHIPSFLLRYKLRDGKKGFDVVYDDDQWVGLNYYTLCRGIVFVHFLAVPESRRSEGFGSKIIDSMCLIHSEKKIVLNIKALDDRADNYQQRVSRKAFYQKNGFSSSGFYVDEPDGRYEMLVRGGNINKKEVAAIYKILLGSIVGFFIRPKVVAI